MATYRQIYISFWSDTKVCDDFTPEDKYFYIYLLTNPHTNMFSPPYGDCTMDFYYWGIVNLFLPPYGDCTNIPYFALRGILLSPPYGDCTLNISQNTAKLKSRMAGKYSLYCNDVLLR